LRGDRGGRVEMPVKQLRSGKGSTLCETKTFLSVRAHQSREDRKPPAVARKLPRNFASRGGWCFASSSLPLSAWFSRGKTWEVFSFLLTYTGAQEEGDERDGCVLDCGRMGSERFEHRPRDTRRCGRVVHAFNALPSHLLWRERSLIPVRGLFTVHHSASTAGGCPSWVGFFCPELPAQGIARLVPSPSRSPS